MQGERTAAAVCRRCRRAAPTALLSSRSSAGKYRRRAPRRAPARGRAVRPCTNRSVIRTLRPRRMISAVRRRRVRRAQQRPRMPFRRWSVSSSNRRRTTSGRPSSSRSVLATWLRLLPTASARLAWGAAEFLHQAPVGFEPLRAPTRSSRCRFSISATSSASTSLSARTSTGTWMQAGALRRSPAPLPGDELGTPPRRRRPAVPGAVAAFPSRGSIASQRFQFGLVKIPPCGWYAPGRISSIATSRTTGPSHRRPGAPRLRRTAPKDRGRAADGARRLLHGPTRRSARAAPQHLAGKLDIGWGAGSAMVVDQHRHAI